MKRIVCILSTLLLLLPSYAQQLKKSFTGTIECVAHIPIYNEGTDFYVNPYAGGQSGDMVILCTGRDSFRIWDNYARVWVSEEMKDIKGCFFLDPDLFFISKNNNRCGIFRPSALDAFKAEDKSLRFTDWRIKQNEQKQIEYLVLALGSKWGVLGPEGEFLVPTRYDSPQKAVDALKERAKAEKPIGMGEIEYIMSYILQKRKEGTEWDFGNLHMDWEWYDPVTGSLYYTIEELPWAGPYIAFSGYYSYEPETLEEGERHVIINSLLGVEEGIISFIPRPQYHSGKLYPLSMESIAAALRDPIPVKGTEGDVFYGEEASSYTYYGMLLHKDGSFEIGYFSGFKYGNALQDIKYICAPGHWEYDDFFLHYVASEHNKGLDPSDSEVLEAFRKQICTSSYDYFFYADGYNDKAGTLRLNLRPMLSIDIATTKAKALKFIKDAESYDCGDFVIGFSRKVTDKGEIYINNFHVTSPSGIHLEYEAQ